MLSMTHRKQKGFHIKQHVEGPSFYVFIWEYWFYLLISREEYDRRDTNNSKMAGYVKLKNEYSLPHKLWVQSLF